jgi:hypothetical protein
MWKAGRGRRTGCCTNAKVEILGKHRSIHASGELAVDVMVIE